MKKLVCRFLCLGIVLAVSMNLVGCSDDDGPVGTLYFPRDVCMVDKPGGTASVEFTAVNIVKLNITDTPEGWTVTADLQTRIGNKTVNSDKLQIGCYETCPGVCRIVAVASLIPAGKAEGI